jgi:succinate dehydrogenase flavin-adding protein (antitoxin of CptAB toxin-antitoxin module)
MEDKYQNLFLDIKRDILTQMRLNNVSVEDMEELLDLPDGEFRNWIENRTESYGKYLSVLKSLIDRR